jgi:hypothetical protein
VIPDASGLQSEGSDGRDRGLAAHGVGCSTVEIVVVSFQNPAMASGVRMESALAVLKGIHHAF